MIFIGIHDELAKVKQEELADSGKRVSFKLAWYISETEALDSIIWQLVKGEWARKDITTFLGISERFLDISMKRHAGLDDQGRAGLLEQIAEVRTRELKDRMMQVDKELFAKDWDLRMDEKVNAVEIFLEETNFSSERIAELVGISVSFVEKCRKRVMK